MYPVGNKCDWDVPDKVNEVVVWPTEENPKPGRPKKERYQSFCEFKRTIGCKQCGQINGT